MQQARMQQRRPLSRRALLASGAGALSAALLGRAQPLLAAGASVSSAAALQTAAALENLAVQVYDGFLALPVSVSGTANAALARVLSMTRMQHADHATAFNSASTMLGGSPRSGVDMAMYGSVVAPALAALHGPADVLRLAITVENVLTATYVSFAAAVDDHDALTVLCTTAPVEAQHAALLQSLSVLLAAGAPELVAIPPDTQTLPAAVGSAGFPLSSVSIVGARNAGEEGS